MKLQIKYNFVDLDSAVAIAHETKDFADIMEVGQLLILKEGIRAVEAFCKNFPDKRIYVDAKLSERPEESIQMFASLGVYYVSVLAGTYHSIIKKACETAAPLNIHIVLDFVNAHSLGQCAMEAKMLGAAAILMHRENTLDEEADNLENDWRQVRDNTDLPIFVQGKISTQSITQILPLRPQTIIVGEAITYSKNPAHEAEALKKILTAATASQPH